MSGDQAAGVRILARRQSTDGSCKFVFGGDAGATFEAVLILESDYGSRSLCMSSQAGCRYGCTHCATTFATTPFVRHLTADEIVASVRSVLSASGITSTLVRVDFAGIGDAAANWSEVAVASECLLDRRMAASIKVTSIAPRAWATKLMVAEQWLPDLFMFSLHGATVAQRRRIIPHGDDPRIVLPVWAEIGRRRPVVLNYVLCEHNTLSSDAWDLGDLLRDFTGLFLGLRLSHLNKVAGSPLRPSLRSGRFQEEVRNALPGWIVESHRSVGGDQNAACGQLRATLLPSGASAGKPAPA